MIAAESRRILIVDDLPEQRDIYVTLLRFHGYEVTEAQDGEAALRAVRECHPCAILMDVVLPGLDGWAATRRLKADPRTAGIPVLVLTARALGPDQERSAEAGADAYLSKPCDPREVLRELQRLIAAAPVSPLP